jgi:hypothetical protein
MIQKVIVRMKLSMDLALLATLRMEFHMESVGGDSLVEPGSTALLMTMVILLVI